MTRLDALERAAVAASRHEWRAVLEWLTEGWADGKHPDLVEAAWALVQQRLVAEPFSERRERDTEMAWLQAKASEEKVTLLRLVSTPWPRLISHARSRVDAIVAGSPGILWSAALASLIRSDPYRSSQGFLLIRMGLRWLVKHADPMAARLVAELRALEPELMRIDLGALSRQQLPTAPPLSSREQHLLDSVENLVALPRRELHALYRDVYANPFDDGRRAVLADALTEAGDPHGEFISLQLLGTSPKHATRVSQLLRTHGATWLKSLGPFIELPASVPSGLFSRGFPSAVRLRPAQTAEIFGRTEAWGTVEQLTVSPDFPFEFHPHLRGLKVLLGLRDAGTTSIPPLERVVIFVDAPLARLPFQRVRELGLIANWVDRPEVEKALAFFSKRAGWFSTIERLCVPGSPKDLAFASTLLKRFPSVQEVACSLEVTGSTLSLPSDWAMKLSRARVMTLTWHGRTLVGRATEGVAHWLAASHVAGLERVVIDQEQRLTPGQRERVIQVLRESAGEWPEHVGLTLFGEDGRL
jgi:uncharacterized protein (TIGR02996 family)